MMTALIKLARNVEGSDVELMLMLCPPRSSPLLMSMFLWETWSKATVRNWPKAVFAMIFAPTFCSTCCTGPVAIIFTWMMYDISLPCCESRLAGTICWLLGDLDLERERESTSECWSVSMAGYEESNFCDQNEADEPMVNHSNVIIITWMRQKKCCSLIVTFS